ncbi:MAG: hypothetical protein AAF995_11115 [Planctomycetota bacterium]
MTHAFDIRPFDRRTGDRAADRATDRATGRGASRRRPGGSAATRDAIAIAWTVSARAATHAIGEANGHRASADATLTIELHTAGSEDGAARIRALLQTPAGVREVIDTPVDNASITREGPLTQVEAGDLLRATLDESPAAERPVIWAQTSLLATLGIAGGMYEIAGLAPAG